MKITARRKQALWEFIRGEKSLRHTAKVLNVKSYASVYIKGFHLLKETLKH